MYRANIVVTFFYFLPVTVLASQSKPSYKPSPVVAQQAWIYHLRERILEGKAELIYLSLEGLFFGGKPTMKVKFISDFSNRHSVREILLVSQDQQNGIRSSLSNILASSSAALPLPLSTRSRSLESTTKIIASVFW